MQLIEENKYYFGIKKGKKKIRTLGKRSERQELAELRGQNIKF